MVRWGMTKPTDRELALWLDSKAGTEDRLTTLLGMAKVATPQTGLQQAAAEECSTALPKFDELRLAPETGSGPVRNGIPLLLLLVLVWLPDFLKEPSAPVDEEREVGSGFAQAAAQVEAWRTRIDEEQRVMDGDEAWEKFQAALDEVARNLTAPTTSREEEESRSFRELARAEQALRELRAAQGGFQDEERQALRNAAEAAGFDGVRQALDRGEDSSALEALQELGLDWDAPGGGGWEQFQETLAGAVPEDGTRDGMKEALAQLASASGSEGLRDSLTQVQEQLSQRDQRLEDQRKAGENAVQQLAQAMQTPGDPYGDPSDGGDADHLDGTEGEGDGAMAGTGDSEAEMQAPLLPAPVPSAGTVGLELDGEDRAPPGGTDWERLDDPEVGDGETLYRMLATGQLEEAAGEGYRRIYEMAAPGELLALDEEEIPTASRLYIRRYFELIRPEQ